MKLFNWEGSLEHRKAIEQAMRDAKDVHGAVAELYDVTRREAKDANFRFLYGNEPELPTGQFRRNTK
jgi:hypothetical protein